MELAPILLFAFKRPDHTRKVLESLAQNKEAKDSELHVFIDGPKENDDVRKIREVQSVINSQQWCKRVSISVNESNQGVPAQVVGNVKKFCDHYGRVIVLEDDLVLSSFFLSYMNKALEVYATQKRVMEVTGYMFPVKNLDRETGFMRGNCGWGWGTWHRAWKHYESDGQKLVEEIEDRNAQYAFDFDGTYGYFRMLKSQVKGKIGGWDIRWYASIFLNNGLTLFPKKSFVKNIGFDGSGTNIPNSDAYNTELAKRPVSEFSNDAEETEEYVLATMEFFQSQKTINALTKKIMTRFKNSLIRR